jgi:hypothetical protein
MGRRGDVFQVVEDSVVLDEAIRRLMELLELDEPERPKERRQRESAMSVEPDLVAMVNT